MWMMDETVYKKALKGYVECRRPVGRPRRRWLDAVGRDAERIVKCRNWKRLAADGRDAWRRKIEKTKAQVGL
jgi:hypothetical protein